jgi:membrane-associated phospholipid phosphatase
VNSTVGPTLLLPRWRLLLRAVVPLSALAVILLGWWYAGKAHAGALDHALDSPLTAWRGQPASDALTLVSDLGSEEALPVELVVLALAARRNSHRWTGVALVVIGPTIAVLLAEFVIKPLVGRTIDSALTLPSGHTTSITALAWVVVLLFVADAHQRSRWLRAGLVVLLVAAVTAVAYSVVALNYHYATDTLAGAFVATTSVGAVALLLDWLQRRIPLSSARRTVTPPA